MSRIFNGETLVKLTLIFSFFACYTWVYHTMTRDEKNLEQLYTHRLQMIERNSGISYAAEPTSDSD